MTRAIAASIGLLLFVLGLAPARSAPAQLLGKSIVVGWSEHRIQRNLGATVFAPVTIRHELRLYVSTAGRVFSRLTNINRAGASGSNDQVEGEEGATRVPQFDGRAMSITSTNRGAQRFGIIFAADFATCEAKVRRGEDFGPGATHIGMSKITGRRIEIRSVRTSDATCRVQAGNVFAGR